MPLNPDLSGHFSTPTWLGDHSLFFARSWAERLIVQVRSAKAAAERLRTISRQIEYGEEWSPSELEYDTAFRALWSECALTVWIADTLQTWLRKLAQEIGEETPAAIADLRRLRNVLAHLDAATFDAEGPHTDPNGTGYQARSLRELPGSRLLIQSWQPGSPLFDLLDVDQLEAIAQQLLDRLENELDDVVEDYVVQEEIDRRLGR